MKNTLKLFACTFSFLLSAFPLSAGAVDWQWANGRKITMIYPNATGLSFYTDGAVVDVNSVCANRFVILKADANSEAKMSAILTAFSINSTINIVFDLDATTCETPIDRFQVAR